MSLSGRLALLTTFFIMIGAILIFVPSLSRARIDVLQERIDDAYITALALLSDDNPEIGFEQSNTLLSAAGVENIVISRDDRRELLLTPPQTIEIDRRVDLESENMWQQLMGPWQCLGDVDGKFLYVTGNPSVESDFGIETTVKLKPVCDALREYGASIALLILSISLVSAVLLYYVVKSFLVKPILRLVNAMRDFEGVQEERAHLVDPTSRIEEINAAESNLRNMQIRILDAIDERKRLADLGQSVAQINHDLRNMLATAQLIADRLEFSDDPKVVNSAPRLVNAIDRATNLCTQVLEYGRTGERPVNLKRVDIGDLLAETVGAEEALAWQTPISFDLDVDDAGEFEVDPDFLSRAVQNLVRNAREALSEVPDGLIRVYAVQTEAGLSVEVEDNGTGIDPEKQSHIFKPFQASTRQGGTGLGLPIVRELIEAMAGKIELEKSDQSGTLFRITIPQIKPETANSNM